MNEEAKKILDEIQEVLRVQWERLEIREPVTAQPVAVGEFTLEKLAGELAALVRHFNIRRLADCEFHDKARQRLEKLEAEEEKRNQRIAVHFEANAAFHHGTHERLLKLEEAVLSKSAPGIRRPKLGEPVFYVTQDLDVQAAVITSIVPVPEGTQFVVDLLIFTRNGAAVAHSVRHDGSQQKYTWHWRRE